MNSTRDELVDKASFFDRSAITHCIFQVVLSKTIGKRLLWIFVVFLTSGAFLINLGVLLGRFFSNPITITTQLSGLQFRNPSITVCNRKIMTISNLRKFNYKAEKSQESQQVWGSMNGNTRLSFRNALSRYFRADKTEQLRNFMHLKQHVSQVNIFMQQYNNVDKSVEYAAMESLDAVAIENLKLVNLSLADFRMPKLGFLMKCTVRGQVCTSEDFYEISHPQYNGCYTFNNSRFSKGRSTQNDRWDLTPDQDSNILPLDLLLYTDAYPDYGSLLTYNSRFTQDVLRKRESGAVDVFVHPENEYPTSVHVHRAPAGFKTTLIVQHHIQKYKNREQNKCAEERNRRVQYRYYPDGSFKDFKVHHFDCQIRRMSDMAEKHCQCRFAKFPFRNGSNAKVTCQQLLKPILKHKNFCIKKLLLKNYISIECNDGLAFFKRKTCADALLDDVEEITSECLPPCEVDGYNVEWQSSIWPQRFAQQDISFFLGGELHQMIKNYSWSSTNPLNGLFYAYKQGFGRGDTRYVTENIARVTVKTNSLTPVKRTIEESAYPLSSMFSDFGGILGLWVGLSVIGVVELVELVVEASCGQETKQNRSLEGHALRMRQQKELEERYRYDTSSNTFTQSNPDFLEQFSSWTLDEVDSEKSDDGVKA